MKKTFRNIRTLAALLMAGAAFTACSSDDNISEQPANPAGEKVYTLTVNATKDVSATTRGLEFSGDKLVAKWKTSDIISVIKLPSSLGTLTPTNISADGQKATFTGTITTSGLNEGDNLILSYHYHGISDFAGQNGMLNGNALYSAEAYDQAEATVTVASIDGSDGSGNITTTADASFTTQTAMIKFTLQDNAATPNKINATSLNVKATITLPAPLSTTITEDLFTFTIAPEAYTYNGNGILYYALPSAATLAGPIATKLRADPYNLTTITESDVVTLLASTTITFTASDGVNTYTVDKTGYPFAAGSYYTSALTMALACKFSVSSTDKVYFSKGNLQATTTNGGSTWTWAFAANQWDYIGNAAGNTSINGNGTVSANGTVDLFGWVGASSTWTGAAQYGISNSTATNNVDGYGNVAGEAQKVGWGATVGAGWRTLTKNEWLYLLSTRETGITVNSTDNARYTQATINTDGTAVKGLIIFPDSYAGGSPAGVTWGTINAKSTFETTCTSAGWTALEAAGCVFLPAAGYRTASSVTDAGVGGGYWSSSSSTAPYAFALYFESDYMTIQYGGSRKYGFSVRLVRDAD